MSILHMEGFDTYASTSDFGQAYSSGNTPTLQTAGGRFGGGAIQFGQNGNENLIKALGATYSDVIFGFAFKATSAPNNPGLGIAFLSSSAGTEFSLCVNEAIGALFAYRGGSSLGSTSGGVIPSGQWVWIEGRVKFSTTVGIVELYVNGVEVLNLTGVNTLNNGGQTGVNTAGIGACPGNYSPYGYADDWYVLDPNTAPNQVRLGNSRISTLVPASDAGPNTGTPDTGTTHYTQVDEIRWSSAHSLTLASGQEELFGMSALGATPYQISAVRVLAVVNKSDAGTCTLEPVIVSGGTEQDGAGVSIGASGASYGQVTGIFEQDPHTSAAWSLAGITAMQCGVKLP